MTSDAELEIGNRFQQHRLLCSEASEDCDSFPFTLDPGFT
jgi:hypothetical protein